MARTGRLAAMFWIMAKIGCFTFGGGWSIIGQMQNEFALAAAFGLTAPAIAAIGLVAYFYSSLKANPYVEKILGGVRCVVIPIILQAAWKLKEKSLTSKCSYLLFAISFAVCAFTNISKPMVIAAGALLGLLVWRGGEKHGTA